MFEAVQNGWGRLRCCERGPVGDCRRSLASALCGISGQVEAAGNPHPEEVRHVL